MLKRLFILLSALLLLSCSSHENNSYLRLRLTDDPTTLDPAYIVDVPGGQVAAKIFDGLVSYDDNARIVPGLASSWNLSPDGLTYAFNIRPGVKFSNGREVASADFKYSFERVLSPKTHSPRTWLFDRIKGAMQFMDGSRAEVTGIRCPDSRTLVIELVSRSDLSWDFLRCPAHTPCRRKTLRNTGSISPTTRWARGPIRFLNGSTEAGCF